jgi:S-adenosylhomocysteine hydrolase
MKKTMTALLLATLVAFTTGLAIAQENAKSSGQEVTATGEVIDMSCYLDHGATGEKHADCAKKCIASGLPVGIKANDGKTYLLIGDHKPLNSELANEAAKTITVKGKLASRDGINMIENAVVQK